MQIVRGKPCFLLNHQWNEEKRHISSLFTVNYKSTTTYINKL